MIRRKKTRILVTYVWSSPYCWVEAIVLDLIFPWEERVGVWRNKIRFPKTEPSSTSRWNQAHRKTKTVHAGISPRSVLSPSLALPANCLICWTVSLTANRPKQATSKVASIQTVQIRITLLYRDSLVHCTLCNTYSNRCISYHKQSS